MYSMKLLKLGQKHSRLHVRSCTNPKLSGEACLQTPLARSAPSVLRERFDTDVYNLFSIATFKALGRLCCIVYIVVYSLWSFFLFFKFKFSISFIVQTLTVDWFYVLQCTGTLLVFAGVMQVDLCFMPFLTFSVFIRKIFDFDCSHGIVRFCVCVCLSVSMLKLFASIVSQRK